MREGYWEQEGRNPLLGALVVVFILGAVYFTVQVLASNLYILLDQFIGQGMGYTPGGFLERMKQSYAHYQKPILAIVMICQFLFFFFPTILIYRKWHSKDWKKDFKLDRVPWLGILVAIVGTWLFLPLAEWLSLIFYKLFPWLEKLGEMQEPLFQADSPGSLFFLLLVIGFTPAVCEEILFRGYLQTVLARRTKGFRIILITAVIFALYHQNPMGLIALTAAGLWLGLLAWKFQSLYVSMTAHLVYNGTIILIYNQKIGAPFITEQGTINIPIGLAATALFGLLAWWIYRRETPQEVVE